MEYWFHSRTVIAAPLWSGVEPRERLCACGVTTSLVTCCSWPRCYWELPILLAQHYGNNNGVGSANTTCKKESLNKGLVSYLQIYLFKKDVLLIGPLHGQLLLVLLFG